MFDKITASDTAGKGNVGQPDTPLLSTTEMQEQMDSLSNLIIERFNAVMDQLKSEEAGFYLGCKVPDGLHYTMNSVEGVTQALYDEIAAIYAAKHSHANKAALDSITATLIANISALLLLMANIDGIDYIVTDSNTALPTSKAVKQFVEGYNYRTIIKNAIFPVGSVYLTTTADPDTIFGTTGAWQLINMDNKGVKTYKRII